MFHVYEHKTSFKYTLKQLGAETSHANMVTKKLILQDSNVESKKATETTTTKSSSCLDVRIYIKESKHPCRCGGWIQKPG